MLFPVNIAFARAGGGGGGSGGSGGGSGGSSGGSTNNRTPYTSNTRRATPIESILDYILFAAFVSGGAIIFFVQVRIKSTKTKNAMKKLSEINSTWDYKQFRKTAEETFYAVQKAWMERDQDISKSYMSQSLYEQYKTKSEWMKLRHEKNILKKMHIIDILPVKAEDHDGDSDDMIWVYIKARMADYIVDDRTMAVKSGSKFNESFEEYWKFIKENNKWVLGEIRQKNEFDVNE